MSSSRISRPPPLGDVFVFLCRTDLFHDPLTSDECRAILDDDEGRQFAQFRSQEDAHIYLVSHALVRSALSLFSDAPAASWQFKRNKYGRPEILMPAGEESLRFNLSHTKGLAACVVARVGEVGIDVESAASAEGREDVASTFFAPAELADLRALPRHEQVNRFLSIWTLKEAYLKARGLGLNLPLDSFAFQIDESQIRFQCEKECDDQADEWSFTLIRPTAEHWLATAVRLPQSVGGSVQLQWFHPIAGIHPAQNTPTIVAHSFPHGGSF